MAKIIKKDDVLKEVKEKLFIKTTSSKKKEFLEELKREGKVIKVNNYYIESNYYNKLLERIEKELDKNFYFKPASDDKEKKILKEILNDLEKKGKVIKITVGKSEIFINKQNYLIPPIFDIVRDIQEFYLSQSPDRKFGYSISLDSLVNYLLNKYSLTESQLILLLYDLRRILSSKIVFDIDKTKKMYQLPNRDFVSTIILYERVV